MKGLFENFSSTESENSFFTRSHNVVEEISSCENFSHSRPSCGTLRNSISRTTGVMLIIFEAHQFFFDKPWGQIFAGLVIGV